MNNPVLRSSVAVLALVVGQSSCSSSSQPSSAPAQLQIVAASGVPAASTEGAVAGDAIALKVVLVAADGGTSSLPSGAVVTWTEPQAVTTLPPNSTSSVLPVAGAQPTAAWVDNTYRPDLAAELANVLFILDPGTVQNATVQVSAAVSGVPDVADAGDVTASIDVDPTPAGIWTRGQALYGASCADCHGATGHGSPSAPEASTYTILGETFDFPVPGINGEPGNTAGDPAWNAALFAVAARADIDNNGVSLRLPMPSWLVTPNPATGHPLSTQDLADIYAFLKTQTH